MVLVAIIILLILAIGGWPAWGVHPYGYAPSGVIGVVLAVLLILLLLGRV